MGGGEEAAIRPYQISNLYPGLRIAASSPFLSKIESVIPNEATVNQLNKNKD